VDLLVARERVEVLAHGRAEVHEPAPQACEPPLDGIAEARLHDVAEAVGPSVAHRAEAEEPALAEHESQAAHAARACRGDAAPVHRTEIGGRRGRGGPAPPPRRAAAGGRPPALRTRRAPARSPPGPRRAPAGP